MSKVTFWTFGSPALLQGYQCGKISSKNWDQIAGVVSDDSRAVRVGGEADDEAAELVFFWELGGAHGGSRPSCSSPPLSGEHPHDDASRQCRKQTVASSPLHGRTALSKSVAVL